MIFPFVTKAQDIIQKTIDVARVAFLVFDGHCLKVNYRGAQVIWFEKQAKIECNKWLREIHIGFSNLSEIVKY